MLDRLHGPAGLYIGSKTPAEIALSIRAEVVAVKNGIDAHLLLSGSIYQLPKQPESHLSSSCHV